MLSMLYSAWLWLRSTTSLMRSATGSVLARARMRLKWPGFSVDACGSFMSSVSRKSRRLVSFSFEGWSWMR